MNRLNFCFYLFITVLFFTACSKDEDKLTLNQDSSSESTITRTLSNNFDENWIKPTFEQLDGVWKDMIHEADVSEIGSFLYQVGFFEWSNARIAKEYEDEDFILSIPTIENNMVSSVLFVGKVSDDYTYWHISLDELNENTTEELLDKYGARNLILAIMEFLQHEKVQGNYQTKALYLHLGHELIANEFTDIHPRGWCLIEVVLYTENQSYDETELCNCNYYNLLTGHTVLNPPSDFNPSEDDPTWLDWHPSQPYMHQLVGADDESIIHGTEGANGMTVYHFWAWCPDEISQDPYTFNWASNIYKPVGEGITEDEWKYDKPRWTEDTKECMFAFDDPKATENINRLEEELLTASCGEASEYIIKSIIDNIILDLCEEYYQNQDGSEGGPHFPIDEGHDMNETLNTITTTIESHTIYQLGIEVCEVCKEVNPPSICYNLVNNCPSENYEACVNDILCDFAIADFEEAYNITFTSEQLTLLAFSSSSNICELDGEEFESEIINTITENTDDCDFELIWCDNNLDDDEAPDGICPSTFDFVCVGNGYTCQVNNVTFKYGGAINRIMKLGAFCIQVPKFDLNNNPISASEAADIMTTIWTGAQAATQIEFVASNHTQLTSVFKANFKTNMQVGMQLGFTGPVSISSGPCLGNFFGNSPKYSVFCF